MQQVVTVVIPVFAIIALGYLMVRRGLFSQSGVDDLTRFIFYIAVPALLFRTSASGVMTEPLEWKVLIAYYGMGVGLFFALTLILRRSISTERSIVAAMSGSFSNLALIGLPVVQTAYGPQGLVPLMTLITFNAMILFTLPSLLIETGRNPKTSLLRLLFNAVKSVLSNPLVIALVAGWVFAELGLKMVEAADRLTELLSKAAAPCALFAVGGGMARYSLRLEETRLPVLVATCAKLIVMPLGVWLLCSYVFALSPLWTMIATLAAALPAGANPFIFATRYGVGDRIAGNTILLTTTLALLSISGFIMAFPAP